MGSGPSLTASETGSDTSATRPPSQIRTNSSQSQSWFQSYFPQALLATRNPTSHAHIRPGPAAIERVLHFLTLKGLPVDLAEKVLDEAEYWSVCKRQCKQPMTIDARMPSPRVRATFAAASTMNQHAHGTGASGNGQEEELAWERSVPDNGLEERNGSAWVVVSGRIGCLSLRDSRRGNENGGMGHTVIDASSDGFDEDRKTIATGNELQRTRPMDSAYLRRVVIDTFSRDQGWSDHAKHYGEHFAPIHLYRHRVVQSRIVLKTLPYRHIRKHVFLVRGGPPA